VYAIILELMPIYLESIANLRYITNRREENLASTPLLAVEKDLILYAADSPDRSYIRGRTYVFRKGSYDFRAIHNERCRGLKIADLLSIQERPLYWRSTNEVQS
jgi:hypothetical protein